MSISQITHEFNRFQLVTHIVFMCNGVVALFENSSNYIYEGEKIALNASGAEAVGEIRRLFLLPEERRKEI